MNLRPVLIEKEDKPKNTVLASSGALIEDKYVLAPSNALLSIFEENASLMGQIEEGKLHLYTRAPIKFHVIWRDDGGELFTVQQAQLFALFKCPNITKFCLNKNGLNLTEALSVLLVLAIKGPEVSQGNLKAALLTWLESVKAVDFSKGDEIQCISSPFGSRDFMNSLSEGIVSTVLKGSTLFLSDCSSAPGSEGGLVYLRGLPIGLVISSFNWWRHEWLGFTLVADIRPILTQLVGLELQNSPISTLSKHLTLFENCLAQINCGANWGSCVLLSKEKRVFLTNAHVVMGGPKIRLLWKNETTGAHLIYKTSEDSVYDLALVKSDDCWRSMRPPNLNLVQYRPGDAVYCVGYPLFSTVSKPEGITVTRGIISACGPFMIKTTCAVYPGFSGGAVLTMEGVLLGIVVSNTILNDVNVTYPKQNMAVPFQGVKGVIFEYLKSGDVKILRQLSVSDNKANDVWRKLKGKL